MEFEREMHLSAQDLALCWDTLLGVLSIGRMLQLEAGETTSSRRSDDGAFVFDLLIHVWSVFHLDCHIKFNLKSNANYPNHRTNTMLMLDDYEKKAGFGSTSLQAICFLTVKCFTCLPPLPGNDVGAEPSQQDKMFAVIVPVNHRSVQLCVIGYKPY